MVKIKILILAALLVMGPGSWVRARAEPLSQWGTYGILINDAPGNAVQQNSRIINLGQEYIIVFEDYRSGHANLFAQKIDAKGKLLWDKDGLPICEAAGDQTFPQVVPAGEKAVILIWQDNRSGNFDIYAQKLDAAGILSWPKDGIQVCGAAQSQVFPQAVTDGTQGAIITWHDYRNGAEDIYAQWLGADGNLYWQAEGVPVCTEPGTQWYPKIESDGAGGAIICWVDRRGGNLDIFAQKLDRSGKLMWKGSGAEVCVMNGNQDNPAITTDRDGGALIAWQDNRQEKSGVYVQRIKKDGQAGLAQGGVLVGYETSRPGIPAIAEDRGGGAVVVWADPHAGDSDIYAQHLDNQGRLLWGEEGLGVARVRGAQENPKISGAGPWAVVFEDIKGARKLLTAQKVDSNGSLTLGLSGVVVAYQGKDQQSPDVLLDQEKIILCFEDKRKGNYDIYAQQISPRGELLLSAGGALINATAGSVVQQNAKTIRDNQGNYFFAFEDYRLGFSNIYLQKVSAAGKLLWEQQGVPAGLGYYNQKNPDLISDAAGGVIVVWEDERNPAGPQVLLQRVNFSGQVLWAEGGLPATPKINLSKQTKPRLAPDGAGGAIVIFCDFRGTLNYQDIYAQRFAPDGKALWGGGGLAVCTGNGNQDDPQIAPKSLVVCWTDYRMGERNSDIYAQKLDLNGKVQWEEDGVGICEAPDSQLLPNILDNGEAGVILIWTDRGGGGYDIYGQRLDPYGRALWIKDGIPICQAARTQQNPQACLSGPANIFVVFEDFRFGNWDIFGQKVDDYGRLKYPEDGVMICSAPGTQYSPFAVCSAGQVIVAWEDYRNGENYNIYLQSLDESGFKSWGEEGVMVLGSRAGGRAPQLVVSKKNEFMVSWEDYRLGGRAIYAQKFSFNQ